MRQWRHEWVNVTPPVEQEPQLQNDIWALESLHGMPKDCSLLAPHSQELLRAARSGRLYKRPAPTDEEEADENNQPEKTDKKEEEPAPNGFSIKVWKQIPRNVEVQTVTHLAKRRKNTVTIASKTVEDKPSGPTVTRATVRRVDAAGNPYTEEVTLADGQNVEGDIISTRVEVVHNAAAPALNVAPPPPRRRPPPPKRKAKAGPGRGKKKNRNPPPGEPGANPTSAPAGLADPSKPAGTEENVSVPAMVICIIHHANYIQGTKPEGTDTPRQDSEMADGDDDDDDDDDGEEGDEGDDDENNDSDLPDTSIMDDTKDLDATMSDAPPPTTSPNLAASEPAPEVPPPNPMTIPPPVGTLAAGSPKIEGSPLKNVLVQSPTERQTATAVPPPEEPSQPMDVETGSTVAQPPSTIVGEEPAAAVERDLSAGLPRATSEENLLPPPPEQVGNIATPKAEDGSEKVSDGEDKSKESQSASDKFALNQQDSIMTEDTIKPEDSASVRFPLTESGAPSEVGTGSADETKELAPTMEAPMENEKPTLPPVDEPSQPSLPALDEPKESVASPRKPDSPKPEDRVPITDPAPEEPVQDTPVQDEQPKQESVKDAPQEAEQLPSVTSPAPQSAPEPSSIDNHPEPEAAPAPASEASAPKEITPPKEESAGPIESASAEADKPMGDAPVPTPQEAETAPSAPLEPTAQADVASVPEEKKEDEPASTNE